LYAIAQKGRLMKRIYIIVAGLCVLGCVLVFGHTPTEDPITVTPEISSSVAVTVANDVLIDDTSSETNTLIDTTEVLVPPSSDADQSCLECHSNAELLQELAEEEDVPEVPSEGSG
jgi:hypothetical protein